MKDGVIGRVLGFDVNRKRGHSRRLPPRGQPPPETVRLRYSIARPPLASDVRKSSRAFPPQTLFYLGTTSTSTAFMALKCKSNYIIAYRKDVA